MDIMTNYSADLVGFICATKAGKLLFVLERQMPHDPQYRIGGRIPGRGKVVEIIGRGGAA